MTSTQYLRSVARGFFTKRYTAYDAIVWLASYVIADSLLKGYGGAILFLVLLGVGLLFGMWCQRKLTPPDTDFPLTGFEFPPLEGLPEGQVFVLYATGQVHMKCNGRWVPVAMYNDTKEPDEPNPGIHNSGGASSADATMATSGTSNDEAAGT